MGSRSHHALLLAAALIVGCSREDEPGPARSPHLAPIDEQARVQALRRADQKAAITEKLDELDKRLDAVHHRRDDASADPIVAKLESERRDLAALASMLDAAEGRAWDETLSSFDRAYAQTMLSLKEERADYLSLADRRLADIDQRIDDVRRRRAPTPGDATLIQLLDSRDKLGVVYGRMRDADDKDWDPAASDFAKAYDELDGRLEIERSDYKLGIDQRLIDLDKQIATLTSRRAPPLPQATRKKIEAMRHDLDQTAEQVRSAVMGGDWKDRTTVFEQRYAELKGMVDKELGRGGSK